MTEIILASLVVFAAYFLKGFTGFGPALVMIPFLSLIFDPGTAIITASFFDFLAGGILFISVRKQIQWKFILPIFTALAMGAIFGSYLLGSVPDFWLKKVIGLAILIFAVIILFQKNGDIEKPEKSKHQQLAKYPIGFFGGFLGGFIGISGPPIIIYMKLFYDKIFFRTQLIGIFFLGSGWRFILYQANNVPLNISMTSIGIFFLVMLAAAWTGAKMHIKVNEIIFNRVVALLLIVPAMNLVFSN